MINKEEIEMAKEQLISLRENAKANIDTDEIFKLDYEAITTILQYISELEANCYEQNNIINNYIEIEKEHQKINGELQEKLTKLEKENKRLNEIIEGKSIQELGMSDIYKED